MNKEIISFEEFQKILKEQGYYDAPCGCRFWEDGLIEGKSIEIKDKIK